MITFLLHGGQAGIASESNDEFFRALVANKPEPVRVLLLPFARKNEEYTERYASNETRIQKVNPKMKLKFIHGEESALAQQTTEADAVYLMGGDTTKLLMALRSVPKVTELLQGKTVAGSSAGAYALAKYYWSNDDASLGKGLGMLPMKIFAHFTPDKKIEYEKLAQYKENLPILALPEQAWVRMKG
ncbi:MAG: Type 1 glutamine amidotransferase-like domain-containing protein [bacterium]|nr:Type 1 glutamine amidotransferase-like domain-containing protein [bacterium]